ncbi:3-hydroxyacyl-ACP dehydratase FabZ family protein [Syntrophomonas palmitatica]|uniref:3-hydroxyacyl-ACP dehydratase FabZ family protein n=1 Tax=Syntrophomonas palmitatica TaxID=402877 RepID=UPI0006D1FB20|nr:3-hydroxyacyl-ACP dehydratase FabZ family protein [Syntrophomonas palmitatica]
MEQTALFNLDAFEIQKYQQNRYPLLFIDYVEEVIPGKSARGYKNFTYNEWFFPAHFEDEPNVPGFIQVEALTQMFLMTFLTIPSNKGKKTSFVSIENAKFKRKIIPGDRLDISSELKFFRRGLAKGISTGHVKGELACSIDLVITIPDILNEFKPKIND